MDGLFLHTGKAAVLLSAHEPGRGPGGFRWVQWALGSGLWTLIRGPQDGVIRVIRDQMKFFKITISSMMQGPVTV